MKKLIVFIVCYSCCITVYAGKKRCQPLLLKLHNIQAQQRLGHSGKKALSLQNKETNIRKKWWQCENSNDVAAVHKHHKKLRRSPTRNILLNAVKKAVKPFFTTRKIVVTSEFKGEKQQAWLLYYQMPPQCRQTKNMQVFAFCVENRHQQQKLFEHAYLN